jgi:hypothetical protein
MLFKYIIHDLIQDSCCWIEDSEKRDYVAVLIRVYVVFDVDVDVDVDVNVDVGAHHLHQMCIHLKSFKNNF